MRLTWFGSTAALIAALVGCGGGAEGDDKGAGGQARGGEGGAGGGAGGETGADGGAGGETGGGGQEPAQCPVGEVSCNGACLPVGTSAGGCTALAYAGRAVSIVHGIAVDASHVYWVEQGGRIAVARVAKEGGEREEVHATEDIPMAIAVDDKNVYWTESFDSWWLRTMPKSGGAVSDLAMLRDLLGRFDGVIADDERVFFARKVYPFDPFEVRSIGLEAGDEIVHGSAGDTDTMTVALDAGFLYWRSTVDFKKDEIVRSPRAGGEPQVIVTAEPDSILGLAVSGEFVYYMSPGTIWRVPASGGAPTEVFSSPDVQGTLFVGHAQSLYWASGEALWRVGTDGENPTQLVRTGHYIARIAADASGVYLAINESRKLLSDGFIVKAED